MNKEERDAWDKMVQEEEAKRVLTKYELQVEHCHRV